MTQRLNRFVASREYRASNADYDYGPHFAYMTDLAIEIVTPAWPEESRKAGAFHLCIGRESWLSNDLRELESLLFAFAESEGYFDK